MFASAGVGLLTLMMTSLYVILPLLYKFTKKAMKAVKKITKEVKKSMKKLAYPAFVLATADPTYRLIY